MLVSYLFKFSPPTLGAMPFAEEDIPHEIAVVTPQAGLEQHLIILPGGGETTFVILYSEE